MTQIIKAESTKTLALRPAASPLIPVERIWAQNEARRILEQARQQARQLVDSARRQARQDRQQAQARGRAEGREEFAQGLAELLRLTRRQHRQERQQAVALAVEMARRLLGEQLCLRPESIQRMCRRVLRENPLGEHVVVQAHPDDSQQLERLAVDLQNGDGPKLKVKVNSRLQRGDLRLEGDWGQVDAGIAVQLQTLRQVLLQLEENHEQC